MSKECLQASGLADTFLYVGSDIDVSVLRWLSPRETNIIFMDPLVFATGDHPIFANLRHSQRDQRYAGDTSRFRPWHARYHDELAKLLVRRLEGHRFENVTALPSSDSEVIRLSFRTPPHALAWAGPPVSADDRESVGQQGNRWLHGSCVDTVREDPAEFGCSVAANTGGETASCERGHAGAWRGVESRGECVRRCLDCRRCRFVTYSAKDRSCRWFADCLLHQLEQQPENGQPAEYHTLAVHQDQSPSLLRKFTFHVTDGTSRAIAAAMLGHGLSTFCWRGLVMSSSFILRLFIDYVPKHTHSVALVLGGTTFVRNPTASKAMDRHDGDENEEAQPWMPGTEALVADAITNSSRAAQCRERFAIERASVCEFSSSMASYPARVAHLRIWREPRVPSASSWVWG